jgi:hypothetical protein
MYDASYGWHKLGCVHTPRTAGPRLSGFIIFLKVTMARERKSAHGRRLIFEPDVGPAQRVAAQRLQPYPPRPAIVFAHAHVQTSGLSRCDCRHSDSRRCLCNVALGGAGLDKSVTTTRRRPERLSAPSVGRSARPMAQRRARRRDVDGLARSGVHGNREVESERRRRLHRGGAHHWAEKVRHDRGWRGLHALSEAEADQTERQAAGATKVHGRLQ